MRLDVGCGSIPRGDVNTDLFIGHSPHHLGFIDSHKIPNFIQSDALHLPFRDEIFQIVYCSHVLEHLINPIIAIRELRRVCYETVFITIPNNPKICEHEEHLYSWSMKSIGNLLKKYFANVRVYGYTKIGEVSGSRLLKFIGKVAKRYPALGNPLIRIVCNTFTLEIKAICKKL